MKIKLICLATVQSGWTDHFATICSGLIKNKHQVIIYASQAASSSFCNKEKESIIIIDYTNKKILRSLFSIFALGVKIRNDTSDCVIIYGESPQHALITLLAKANYITHIADPASHAGIKLIESYLFKISKIILILNSKKIFFASNEVLKIALNSFRWISRFATFRKKFEVVKFANLVQFEKLEIKNKYDISKKWDFIFFGRIEKYKGMDVFAKAVNSLAAKGLNLKILIISKNAESIKNLFKFDMICSYLSHEELAHYINSTSFAIFPYLEATGSHTVQISNYYGIPVIASNTGSFIDYIVDGVNGKLFDVGDSIDLMNKLENCMSNKYNEVLRGRPLRQWSEIFFSNESSTIELENIILKI